MYRSSGLQIITGIATHVRSSAEVYGNQHGVGTSQILGFRIGSQSVELNMPVLPKVEDGDEVVVAGDINSGVLHGRAYCNRSTGAYGRWARRSIIGAFLCAVLGSLSAAFLCAIFVAAGLRSEGVDTATSGMMMLMCIAVPVALGGLWFLRKIKDELKTGRALRLARR
jgi:hypothetical protein